MLHDEVGRTLIVNGKETKLSNILYNILLYDYNTGIFGHKWIRCIRDIPISVGQTNLLHKSYTDNPRSVKISMSRFWMIYIFNNGFRNLIRRQNANLTSILSKIKVLRTTWLTLIKTLYTRH